MTQLNSYSVPIDDWPSAASRSGCFVVSAKNMSGTFNRQPSRRPGTTTMRQSISVVRYGIAHLECPLPIGQEFVIT